VISTPLLALLLDQLLVLRHVEQQVHHAELLGDTMRPSACAPAAASDKAAERRRSI
jgi:hypothetical protein